IRPAVRLDEETHARPFRSPCLTRPKVCRESSFTLSTFVKENSWPLRCQTSRCFWSRYEHFARFLRRVFHAGLAPRLSPNPERQVDPTISVVEGLASGD